MFTLGNKEAIVNAPGQLPVDISTADLLKVRGFGDFHKDQIVSCFSRRYTPEALGVATLTCPSAAAMGIGTTEFNVPVKFHLRLESTRYDADWGTNFIRRNRPIIVEFNVNGTDTATLVATALEAAFASWIEKFTMGVLPFTVSRSTDTLTLTIKSGYSYVDFVTRTVFLASTKGSNRSQFDYEVSLVHTTKSAEPINSGKFLEENTAMGLHQNMGNYAIGGPNKGPDITAGYTAVTFVAKASEGAGVAQTWAPHNRLATVSADALVGTREMTFTLYFKEDTALMDYDADIVTGGDTRGDLQKVVDFLVTDAGLGITTFYKADGTAASSVADFMA